MRNLRQVLAIVAVLALLAPPALAQRPGGFGQMPSIMVLNSPDVQKELKLTDDQITKVKEASTKAMEGFQGLRDLDQAERTKKMRELSKESDKIVADILKPEQTKRFKQITLQQAGVNAFANPDVVKELKLDDEQKTKVKTIQDDLNNQRRELFQGGGDRQEIGKKMAELTKSTHEKVMKVLTDEQKAKWKELTGEPFKGRTQIGRPGGGA